MSPTAPAGTAERLIAAIEEAAEFPELDDDHAKELCVAGLRKIVDVVREGYKLKLGGEMSDVQWASVLRKADSAITEFCDSAMEESVFDGRNAIEFALPEVPSNHIKLELSMSLTRKAYDGLYKILIQFRDPNAATPAEIDAKMKRDMIPPPWTSTTQYQPSRNSHVLARFLPSYDRAEMENAQNAISSRLPNARETLQPTLYAHMEVREDNIANPAGLVIGGNTVIVSQAGGWKEREGFLGWYSVPTGPVNVDEEQTTELTELEELQPGGFGGVPRHLVADDTTMWAAGDMRIKGYPLDTHKPAYTLNSWGYDGAFGVSATTVFRASPSQKGQCAVWQRSELVNHTQHWRTGYGEDDDDDEEDEAEETMTDDGTTPFGGKLSHSSMEWTDDSTEVEISQGQKPTSFFNVPNLDGAFEFLRAAPNSSKWLYTTEGSKSTHGIYTFDAAQPESGASVIGLGGIGVMSLQTHKDVPEFFVAAGTDSAARIYDYRDPFPQMVLEGHSSDAILCTIAPYGGQFPLLFTGGHDEFIKTWDIRHTKACLHELATGTLKVRGMAWHEDSNSLWFVGENIHLDRMGQHHGYKRVSRLGTGRSIDPMTGGGADSDDEDFEGDDDDLDEDEDEDDVAWPYDAHTWPQTFGKPWASLSHAVVQYRFRNGADPTSVPVSG